MAANNDFMRKSYTIITQYLQHKKGGIIIDTLLTGYDYFTDPETGESLAIRRATGEVSDTTTVTLPVGSSWYTPEDRERATERKQEIQEYFAQKAMTKGLGKFCFISKNAPFSDMSPATVARLIFLSTYLRYDTDELYRTQRTPMTITDLPEVLRLSEATVRRFLAETVPQNLRVDDNGHLHMAYPSFVRGRLPKQDKQEGYQKIYCDAVRRLYRNTKTRNHRQLGYIFLLLPYINIKHNVLCHNPYEMDLEEVQFLTIGEFCKAIGHSYSTAKRLLETYSQIKFEVDGKDELFCAFVFDGSNYDDAHIFINPRILYSGSNYKLVEVLGGFRQKFERKRQF